MTTSMTSADATSNDSATDDSTGDPPLPEEAIAVAVGYGTRRVRSENGLNWSDFVEVDPAGGDDNNLLRGVGYGAGTFIAVGGATTSLVLRSPDGIQWETIDAGLQAFLSDVVWQDDVFVAAGGNGQRAVSSDNGATWSATDEFYPGHFRGLAAGNGVFVAAGHTYGDDMIGMWSVSSDGLSWGAETTGGAPIQDGGLAFGAGTFVVRDSAGALTTSSDGGSWAPAADQFSGPGSLIYADGSFFTSDASGVWESSDGSSWTMVGPSNGRALHSWIDGQFLSLGWPLSVSASPDLALWVTVFSGEGSGLTDIAVGVPGA